MGSNLLIFPATVRLTKLLLEDYITAPMRDKVWSKYHTDTKIGYLFTCPWCMSIWSAASLALLSEVSPRTSKLVNTVLTASLITGYADRIESRY